MNNNKILVNKINTLRKAKNAIILAHYYQIPEIQEIADFVGDSLDLSRKSAETNAYIIVFAGINFMAKTAKILSPQKRVFIPDPNAGCSLAESCPAEDFKKFRGKNPDHLVVAYVNTTADIKAMTDITCTSTNAVRIIESIPKDQKIILAPDRYLSFSHCLRLWFKIPLSVGIAAMTPLSSSFSRCFMINAPRTIRGEIPGRPKSTVIMDI